MSINRAHGGVGEDPACHRSADFSCLMPVTALYDVSLNNCLSHPVASMQIISIYGMLAETGRAESLQEQPSKVNLNHY